MTRQAAQALIGTRVEAWTAANGIYVGTLVEVRGSPWRGTVEIDGVLRPADFEYGRPRPRRGFRPGERLEVGGINIRPTTERGISYLSALVAAREHLRGVQHRLPRPSYHHQLLTDTLDYLEQQINAEFQQPEAQSHDPEN